MAIALDSSGGGAVTTAATSFPVNITSAATGSFIFMWVAWGLQNATFTAPAGWRQILAGGPASTLTCGLFYHRKVAGETTVNFTVGSAKGAHGWVSYTGLDTTMPYAPAWAAQNFLAKSSASTTVATPSVASAYAGAYALAFHAHRSSTSGNKVITWTADAALTERVDQNNSAATSSIWTGVEIADSNGAVTVASHSYTATASFSESFGGGALIYLVPAGAYTGPQLVSLVESSYTTTTTPKTLTAVGALSADLVIAMFGGDNFSTATSAASTSTSAGTTGAWTEVLEALVGNTSSPWKSNAWADVTGNGDVTASMARTQSSAQVWGAILANIRNHGGIGNTAGLTDSASDTVSLTTSAGSMVIGFGIEWDHISPATALTPADAFTVEANADLTAVSWYAGYWLDQPAGTRSYGIATNTSAHFSWTVIEILAPASTTPIGKDLSVVWDDRAALGDSCSLIWDVRSAVSDDLVGIWDVRANIGDEVALSWDLRAALGDEVALVWDVRSALGDELSLLWDVASSITAIGKDLSLVWDTRAPLGDTIQAIWDVRAALGDTLQTIWDVRAALGDEVGLTWDIRAVLGDEVGLVWDVRTAVGDPIQVIWDVRSIVGDPVVLVWDVRSPSGQTLQLIWDVQGNTLLATKDLSLVWNISAFVSDTLTLNWDVRSVLNDDLAVVWDIRASAASALQALWDVRSVVGDPVTLQWDLRSISGDDLTLRWDLRAATGDNLTLIWQTDSLAPTLQYSFLTSVPDRWQTQVVDRWDLTVPERWRTSIVEVRDVEMMERWRAEVVSP